jgi:hypothetical protein
MIWNHVILDYSTKSWLKILGHFYLGQFEPGLWTTYIKSDKTLICFPWIFFQPTASLAFSLYFITFVIRDLRPSLHHQSAFFSSFSLWFASFLLCFVSLLWFMFKIWDLICLCLTCELMHFLIYIYYLVIFLFWLDLTIVIVILCFTILLFILDTTKLIM